jgi:hypothetical protein
VSTPKTSCVREGLTPIPEYGVLLIDCSVHGPVGVIRMGEDEYGRAEAEFAKHLLPYADLKSRNDAAYALTERHPLRHWDTQWPIRAALEGMTLDEYAGDEDGAR